MGQVVDEKKSPITPLDDDGDGDGRGVGSVGTTCLNGYHTLPSPSTDAKGRGQPT